MNLIDEAVGALRRGDLVIIPTETVYGLAGDATKPEAIASIYALKGRPRFNPLIAHVPDLNEALRHADLPAPAQKLAEAFWPGPLTLVAPRRLTSSITELACAGLASVALRAPAHPVAQELLRAFGKPLAAPSANRSGRISPTTAEAARAEFADAAPLILEGGPCAHGLESTIIGFENNQARLLRPGAIAREAIEALIGPLGAAPSGVHAPGMLSSHYAPRARLRLNAEAPQAGEAYLAFGSAAPPGALSLSESGDLTEAAAKLYAHLRALDASGADVIAVAPIPMRGLGEAINDRLARAAAPRD
jgi:L-threonylcarbamoyladenylate synthase